MTAQSNWRTPLVVLIASGAILTLSLGTRHSFGLYLQPMTFDLGWSRQTFALALAIQNLVYGLGAPFAGMISDRYGALRALLAGALIYAFGVALMAYSASGWEFSLSAGLLVGIGLSCTGFSVVYGVVGRAFPPERRTVALGIAGAAGSFGQFLMVPYGQLLINRLGWHDALLVCAATVLLIAPLASALVEDRRSQAQEAHQQSIPEALREAFGHGGYLLLCSGYFVCGFQLMFISVHFPAYLVDQRMTPETGMTALALIGLFNIFGTYLWGWLGQRYVKKRVLAALYLLRAVLIAAFISAPVAPLSVFVFSAAIGFLWLGTVPVTGGLIAQIFGVKYLSTLTGIAFLYHQLGSFIGVWIAGYLFDATGSYRLMWLLTIAMGVVAALINLPIDDRPLSRPAARPA
ncbi:MAG TPA: MFS transporter [Burkholderiales bacterium]|nr:MFS transporter [Burkholderiales bacterium]